MPFFACEGEGTALQFVKRPESSTPFKVLESFSSPFKVLPSFSSPFKGEVGRGMGGSDGARIQ